MTIKKLLLPNEKGQLKEKTIGSKATPPNKLIIPPFHAIFMLSPDGKIHTLQVEFTMTSKGVGNSQIIPLPGCIYTVAATADEARNKFIKQLESRKKKNNDARKH